MNKVLRGVACCGAAAGLAVVLAGELGHALARRVGTARPAHEVGRDEAIIVLGYPARPDGSPHPLQHWRADIAARSINPQAARTRIVCTGYAGQRRLSEARMLADLLVARGVPARWISVEEQATTTWQNIEFAVPLVADAEVIKVVSNGLHALRGRRFVRRQFPELADRLAPADDYRIGERWWLKVPAVVYEAVNTWREWRNPRLPQTQTR